LTPAFPVARLWRGIYVIKDVIVNMVSAGDGEAMSAKQLPAMNGAIADAHIYRSAFLGALTVSVVEKEKPVRHG
jgi:hypothetical protein